MYFKSQLKIFVHFNIFFYFILIVIVVLNSKYVQRLNIYVTGCSTCSGLRFKQDCVPGFSVILQTLALRKVSVVMMKSNDYKILRIVLVLYNGFDIRSIYDTVHIWYGVLYYFSILLLCFLVIFFQLRLQVDETKGLTGCQFRVDFLGTVTHVHVLCGFQKVHFSRQCTIFYLFNVPNNLPVVLCRF